ncbi:hypothetical protein C8Q76DRAFT_242997 [Earliella scabrosa]|nr:hypothetical protein C8Q76DRAFT_242997 [Earliella scabrosa]
MARNARPRARSSGSYDRRRPSSGRSSGPGPSRHGSRIPPCLSSRFPYDESRPSVHERKHLDTSASGGRGRSKLSCPVVHVRSDIFATYPDSSAVRNGRSALVSLLRHAILQPTMVSTNFDTDRVYELSEHIPVLGFPHGCLYIAFVNPLSMPVVACCISPHPADAAVPPKGLRLPYNISGPWNGLAQGAQGRRSRAGPESEQDGAPLQLVVRDTLGWKRQLHSRLPGYSGLHLGCSRRVHERLPAPA